MSERLEPDSRGPVNRIEGRLAAARAEPAARARFPSPTPLGRPAAPQKPKSGHDWGPLLVGAGCVVLCALLMAILIMVAKPGVKGDPSASAGSKAPPPAQVQKLCSDLRGLEPSLAGTTPTGTGAGNPALALRERAASASSVLAKDLTGLNGVPYAGARQLLGTIDAVATWQTGKAVEPFSQTSMQMRASLAQFATRYC